MLLASFSVLGQRGKITNTYSYLKYGDIEKAQVEIEKAYSHEVTSKLAKTHYYRGKVYQAIYSSPHDSIKQLATAPLDTAITSYLACYNMEEFRKVDEFDLKQQLNEVGRLAFNEGAMRYNASDFEGALRYFDRSEAVQKQLGKQDSLLPYYTALSLIGIQKYEEADAYLRSMPADKKQLMARLSVYQSLGNRDSITTIVEQGLQLFPDEIELLKEQAQQYVDEKKYDQALGVLNEILKSVNTEALYMQRAFVHQELGDIDGAIHDYQKVLQQNVGSFAATYNLGAAYFNQAVTLNEKGENLDEVKRLLQQSQPYMEKAFELDSSDENVKQCLQYIYQGTGQAEKLEQLDKK